MKGLLFYVSAGVVSFAALEAAAASPWLSKVYDFRPAPGQFVNTLPELEEGDTQEDINEKVMSQLCGAKTPGMVSLGAWGGYVVVGFDHPVVNVAGEYDFRIYGNSYAQGADAKGGSSEPAIVMVSADTNGNGIPDDEWYELAGSEYSSPETMHGYEIVYYRPAADKVADPDPERPFISDRTYIRWSANQPEGAEGYVFRNSFHTQSYWPGWIEGETLVFGGARLADNYVDMSGTGSNYVQYFKDWGYADNRPNAEDPGFKIDWAVDNEGNPVKLGKIDFIKIYTAVNQDCGWLGESSAEICGGEDLHPDAVEEPGVGTGIGNIDAAAHVVMLGERAGMLLVRCDAGVGAEIYGMDGVCRLTADLAAGDNRLDVSALQPGVYVLRAGGRSFRFMKS